MSKSASKSLLNSKDFTADLKQKLISIIRTSFPDSQIVKKSAKHLPSNSLVTYKDSIYKFIEVKDVDKFKKEIEADISLISSESPVYNRLFYLIDHNFESLDYIKLKIEHDPSVHLVNVSELLSLNESAVPLSKVNTVEATESKYAKIHSIRSGSFDLLDNIFQYVNEKYALFDYDIFTQRPDISNKIKLNFYNDNDRDKVRELYNRNWANISSVENYIKLIVLIKPTAVITMLGAIISLYSKLVKSKKRFAPINFPSILDEISEEILPSNDSTNIITKNYSLAIVLFFFETCDFGKPTQNEKSSIMDMFIKS